MFGYLVIDRNNLSKESRDCYLLAFCGLCTCLNYEYGLAGRKTLSFDLTFVDLLYSSIYETEDISSGERCPVHPLRKQKYWFNDFTKYCADMNIVLTYYKDLDDWNDDKSTKAKKSADELSKAMEEIRAKYPQQCQIIDKCMSDLGQMELHNEINCDKPANCFGMLMSQVFLAKDDELSPLLGGFGYELGKFIYLMDATMDFKDDIKNEQYNPLVGYSGDREELLELTIADCLDYYNQLPITKYQDILENILYSGVWMAYDVKFHRHKKGNVE